MMTYALLERRPPRSRRYARAPAPAPPATSPPALPDGASRSAAQRAAAGRDTQPIADPTYHTTTHITTRKGDLMQSIRRRILIALAVLAGVSAPFVTTMAAGAEGNFPF